MVARPRQNKLRAYQPGEEALMLSPQGLCNTIVDKWVENHWQHYYVYVNVHYKEGHQMRWLKLESEPAQIYYLEALDNAQKRPSE